MRDWYQSRIGAAVACGDCVVLASQVMVIGASWASLRPRITGSRAHDVATAIRPRLDKRMESPHFYGCASPGKTPNETIFGAPPRKVNASQQTGRLYRALICCVTG